MNLMLLLAQVAPALADSVAGANPVLTPIAAPDEMNLWSMAVKGGWIMVVLGVLSVVCFYILFERNYVIRKAGKEDPMFMDKIKDYILGGEIKAAIAYCRSVDTPSARMIEKGISRLGRPVNDVQAAIENVGNIEVAKLEKGLTIMATISGGAPMIGFLGTVTASRKQRTASASPTTLSTRANTWSTTLFPNQKQTATWSRSSLT